MLANRCGFNPPVYKSIISINSLVISINTVYRVNIGIDT